MRPVKEKEESDSKTGRRAGRIVDLLNYENRPMIYENHQEVDHGDLYHS